MLSNINKAFLIGSQVSQIGVTILVIYTLNILRNIIQG